MSFSDQKRGIEDRFHRMMHSGADNVITVALTVNGSANTVSRATGSFISDGVSIGDYVSLLDFVNEGNNQVFEVLSVAALTLTLNDPNDILTTETGTITSYAFPAVPIAYENIPFEPKDDDQIYVTCMIVEGDGSQITLGDNPVFRYVGLVQNSIYGPTGIGTDFARLLADRIAKIWRRVQFSFAGSGEFTFYAPSMSPLDYRTYSRLGVRAGNYRADVTTPYHRDIVY